MKGDPTEFMDPEDRDDALERPAIDPAKPLMPPRRELFVQNLVAGMNYGQAYVAAGFKSPDFGAEAAKHPDITARIDFLVNELTVKFREDVARARCLVIYEQPRAMAEAEEVRLLAMRLHRPGAALGAVVLKARIAGLLKTEEDGINMPLGDMTLDQVERFRVAFGAKLRDVQQRILELEPPRAEGDRDEPLGHHAGTKH